LPDFILEHQITSFSPEKQLQNFLLAQAAAL